MTIPRLEDLAEMHGETYRRHLHDMGVVMAFAHNEPGKLRDLVKPARSARVAREELHPLIAGPRKPRPADG